jgi:heme-degrading monooxygenase HmoA
MYERDVVVSLTGLELKPGWDKLFSFIWHAVGSLNQAKKATGNLHADAFKVGHVYHTCTVWENEDHIKAYIMRGSHKKAIKAFRWMATGKTYRYVGRTLPTPQEVHQLLNEKGRVY